MTTPGHGPDMSADTPPTPGGAVRTPLPADETDEGGQPPTSADTVRTPADTVDADVRTGVRIEYCARVIRRHLGAALAEALHHIARETAPPEPDPGRTDP